MMMRERDPRSLLDVYRLAYEASFFPGRFVATRDMWSGMINGQERKCAVCNVLLVVPSLALIFHVSRKNNDENWSVVDVSELVSEIHPHCYHCTS